MIPSPTTSRTRSARALLASVVVLAAMVAFGGPAVLAGVVTGAGVLSGSCASAGEVHAGLVVDFGTVDTGTARPADTADCVADPGANGATLLAKRFGKSRIRIGSNGLICAIDDYPATGCGDHLANGKYRYWSYWKAVGDDDKEPPVGQRATKWQYSPVGPAGRAVKDGTVDGWHFVEGSASPLDGTPGNASPAGPCPLTTPTTDPATPPPTTGGGAGGSGDQATPTSNGSSSTDSTSSSVAPSGDTPVTAADGSVVESGAATAGAAEVRSGSSTDDLSDVENAADVGGSGPSGGGGLPLAAIGVALAIVALSGGAVLRTRGRTDE